jgi:hypothetical protein
MERRFMPSARTVGDIEGYRLRKKTFAGFVGKRKNLPKERLWLPRPRKTPGTLPMIRLSLEKSGIY